MNTQHGHGTTPPLRKLRPLGALEKYKVVRSQLGIYYKVAVTAVYTRQIRNHARPRPLKPALFHALRKTILAHPALSAIPIVANTAADVDGATPSPSMYFAQLPSIDLLSVVTFADMSRIGLRDGVPTTIDVFLEDEHNRPFQYTDPLSPFWRLYVFAEADENASSDFVVAFVFHHCIADTLGALVFHETLEAALSEAVWREGDCESGSVVVPAPATLPPPLDDFLSDEESNHNHATQSSSSFTGSGGGDGRDSSEWSGSATFLPVRTRFKSHWLSKDTTQGLLQASKVENVSLTAALQSMLAAALFRQLPREYSKIKMDCAMSLRPWLAPSVHPQTLGVFTDGFSIGFERGPGAFSWADAVRTKHAISQNVAAGRGKGSCSSLRRVADLTAWLQAKLGSAHPSAMELSNVGRMAPLSDSASKEFEIRSLLFSQSACACSGAIKVSAVTGRSGQLALGFSWQEGVLEGFSVDKLIEDFEMIVREALLRTEETSGGPKN